MSNTRKKANGSWYFQEEGWKRGETLFQGAVREVKEETGLDVVADRIVYTREILAGKDHGVEFYVVCRVQGGELALGSDSEHEDGNLILKDVHEVPIEDFVSMDNWYPTELHPILEKDFKDGFPEVRFLGTVHF